MKRPFLQFYFAGKTDGKNDQKVPLWKVWKAESMDNFPSIEVLLQRVFFAFDINWIERRRESGTKVSLEQIAQKRLRDNAAKLSHIFYSSY